MLIQNGATLVLEPEEIIQKYKKREIEQITIEELKNNLSKKEIDLNNIEEDYRTIYEILKEELSINEISMRTEIGVLELYEKLFMMEIEGLVYEERGKYNRKG